MPRVRIACWGEAEKLFSGRDSILRREDCEVLLAASGRELLDLARRARPDLVLIDQETAGDEFLGLCRRLKSRRQTSAISIVLMCQELGEEEIRMLGSLGIEGILRQPTQHKVSQSVARLLGVEVRDHPRFSIEAPADLLPDGQGSALASRMIDLSVQGAQLEIDHPVQLGSGVTLTFSLPRSGEALQLHATVVRIHADPLWGRNRLGLRFVPLEPPARDRLAALVDDLARAEEAARRSARPRPETPRHLF